MADHYREDQRKEKIEAKKGCKIPLQPSFSGLKSFYFICETTEDSEKEHLQEQDVQHRLTRSLV